ncbi:hypothetical protein BDN72DRAFT_804284 [Pluteus cervinus]|uniref:Uncharacterized protein n=2 Tax=Pluteus cervinus TaxID=181527 RepID=A0ACD3A9H4_9AGAR|nr:hypothetical protein BDN72DRAFT_882741 [Pluteus cervinus]TFK62316.1 hypothetical protein BDN72DRAFT_804284 [Pluteus cervinus]
MFARAGRSSCTRLLRTVHAPPVNTVSVRYTQTKTTPAPVPSQTRAAQQPKSWLTQQVESSPAAKKLFIGITNAFGYGSPKQIAGRRAFAMYEEICAVRPDAERDFWQQECLLPPTFQSWFTVTNLHIWLLTVRLRALPEPHGKAYIQALVDHYFIDIEDRIRAVLQPSSKPLEPYTFDTPFYVKPNSPDATSSTTPTDPTKSKKLGRAPDRIVTQQMKIFREQWAGLGLSFDLSLVQGDMEMAGAVWRNILGARGAGGISFHNSTSTKQFRRTVNLVGGEVVNVAKLDVAKEEMKDDGSGVHDFPPEESDKYLAYPELMLTIVSYVRRELVRLEAVSDEEIISGDIRKLAFGKVRP